MVDSVLVRAQRLWEELAGGRFPGPGLVRVIENPASRLGPSDWAGIVRIEASVLATAPTVAEAELLQRTLDPAALPVLDPLGPAELAYLPEPPASADTVEWAEQADLSQLVAAVPSDDADESGIPALQ